LLESNHYHISYLAATGRPKVVYFDKSNQGQRTAAKAAGLDNKKTYPKVTTALPGPTDSATTAAASPEARTSPSREQQTDHDGQG
jgi:hypothetical protein